MVLKLSSCGLHDGHALAFACAQLCVARVPIPVVKMFVRVYLDTVTSSDFAVSVRGTLESGQVGRVLSEFTPTGLLPYATWQLDGNKFSGRGAAAIVAAAAAVGDGALELDLSTCENVISLELAPYAAVVGRIRGAAPCGLGGLRIDECGLRSLGRSPQAVLHGIQWLSMRGTAIGNLWTAASIVSDLASLRAVLFRGKPDRKAVENVKELCLRVDKSAERMRKRKTRLHLRDTALSLKGDASARAGPSVAAGGVGEEQGEGFLSSIAAPLSNGGRPPKIGHDAPTWLRDAVEAIANEMQFPYLPTSFWEPSEQGEGSFAVWTPVSRVRHYREFMLVHAKKALMSLDEVLVTREHTSKAREAVRKWFELPGLDEVHVEGVSKLLRARELECCTRRNISVSRQAAKSHPKRRRNADRELDATLEAILTGGKAARVSGTASTSRGHSFAGSSSGASFFSIGVNESWDRVYDKVPVDRRFSPQGVAGIVTCDFERRASDALLSRSGFPRVEYLCLPSDRPRQFEYNELDSRLLVYGTEHGNLVVLNQDSGIVEGSCRLGGGVGHVEAGISVRVQQQELPEPNMFTPHRPVSPGDNVLGLSWFHKDSNLFVSGSENGKIYIYNVGWMRSGVNGGCVRVCDEFRQLTSLHTNCTDDRLLVSGYRSDVALYDLGTGKEVERVRRCHKEHINVVKFSHHNPNVFVTSSFDTYVKKWDLRERRPNGAPRPIYSCQSKTGNVMVCFSPDDRYFLVSAENNEVHQYDSRLGLLDRTFDIPKGVNEHNYTRSYYMNDRDYIISGSCTESVVRVYNARTGRFYREVDMDNRTRPWATKVYVQSLRANPRYNHQFSALISSNSETPYFVIASVDLHARAQ